MAEPSGACVRGSIYEAGSLTCYAAQRLELAALVKIVLWMFIDAV
jgi:hypothetical protein